MVMIIEVFIAQHQTIDPATKELLNPMFNITLVPIVGETAQRFPCPGPGVA